MNSEACGEEQLLRGLSEISHLDGTSTSGRKLNSRDASTASMSVTSAARSWSVTSSMARRATSSA